MTKELQWFLSFHVCENHLKYLLKEQTHGPHTQRFWTYMLPSSRQWTPDHTWRHPEVDKMKLLWEKEEMSEQRRQVEPLPGTRSKELTLQLLAPSAFPPLPLMEVDPGGLNLEGFGWWRLTTAIWDVHLWVGSPQRHLLPQPAGSLVPPVVLSLMWSPLLPVGFRELGCGEAGYEESEDDICGASSEAHAGVWPDERRMGESSLSKSPSSPPQSADGPGFSPWNNAVIPPVPTLLLSPLVPVSCLYINSWAVFWRGVHHVEELLSSDGCDCKQTWLSLKLVLRHV